MGFLVTFQSLKFNAVEKVYVRWNEISVQGMQQLYGNYDYFITYKNINVYQDNAFT